MKGGFGRPNPLSYVHIMIISANIVIQSHLSDAMIEMYTDSRGNASKRLQFVKYLIVRFPDTKEEIDVDEVYEEFLAVKEEKQRASRLDW
jgi:hypothetical protein